jgi:hypothetical protein
MPFLVIEKYVRASSFEDRRFFQRSYKVRLIGRGSPDAEGANDPFMSRRVACGHDSNANATRTVRFHEKRPKS